MSRNTTRHNPNKATRQARAIMIDEWRTALVNDHGKIVEIVAARYDASNPTRQEPTTAQH